MVYAGIPPTVLTAGPTATVNCDVAEPFRPERLVVAGVDDAPPAGQPAITSDFTINQILVGTIQQSQNSIPAPAIAFSADAVGVRLKASTAQPGVGVNVTYTAGPSIGGNLTITGVFIGPALTP